MRFDQVIALATLLSTLLTLPPTEVIETIAATEINEAISVYSMAVAPCSFFINRRKMDSICISKKVNSGCAYKALPAECGNPMGRPKDARLHERAYLNSHMRYEGQDIETFIAFNASIVTTATESRAGGSVLSSARREGVS